MEHKIVGELGQDTEAWMKCHKACHHHIFVAERHTLMDTGMDTEMDMLEGIAWDNEVGFVGESNSHKKKKKDT